MSEQEELETCPECGEECNITGFLTNEEEGKKIPCYGCEPCDQTYGWIKGTLVYAPYTYEGKPIEIECHTCGIVSRHRPETVYVMQENGIFDAFCPDCGIAALRNSKVLPVTERERINKDTVYEIAVLQHIMMNNHIMSDPVLFRQLMSSPEIKELAKQMGLSEEEIKARIETLAKNAQTS